VLRLLEDDWLEVREKASQVLGGLLHCDFIESSADLIVSCISVPLHASAFAYLISEQTCCHLQADMPVF
jgi:hypothetical protein